MHVDHVVYATADLDGATARLAQQLGIEPQGGGRHEGLGTHNRIIPLGGGYLEVLAIADADEAASSPIGLPLEARLATVGEGLWTWAVGVADVEPLAQRLETDLMTVSREGMSARVTGVAQSLATPGLPFFIERDEVPGAHPSAEGISWLEVAVDAALLDAWLGDHDMPVRAVGGDRGLVGVGIGARELR